MEKIIMNHVDKLKEKINLSSTLALEPAPQEAPEGQNKDIIINLLMNYFCPNYRLKNEGRIAVCFTGQIRTGIEVAPMMKQFFGKMYDQLDFFIYTWDTESFSPWAGHRKNINSELIVDQLIPINPNKIEKIKQIYNPISMVVDNLSEYRRTHPNGVENRAGIYNSIPPRWISAYECNKLRKKYELLCGNQYRLVLRIRFDVIFTTNYTLIKEVQYMPSNPNALYSVDRHNRFHEAVEDIAWLAPGNIIDKAIDFALHREEENTNKIDEYQDFRQYLIENQIHTRPFKNNDVYLYRDFDITNNLSPFDKPLNNDETTLE